MAGAARPATVPGFTSQVLPPFTFFTLLHARLVRVAAAHEVPVAGAGHRVAVLRIVDEDPAPAELEARVRPVVVQLPVALARPARERHRVAEVVAVDHVHGQPRAQRRAQRLRADDVAAVDHRLRAQGAASRTAPASASARSWLSETMHTFIAGRHTSVCAGARLP